MKKSIEKLIYFIENKRVYKPYKISNYKIKTDVVAIINDIKSIVDFEDVANIEMIKSFIEIIENVELYDTDILKNVHLSEECVNVLNDINNFLKK